MGDVSTTDTPPASLLRIRHILERTSLSRATIYRMISARTFPRPMRMGGCAVWLESDLDKWIAKFLKANERDG